ncbi:hypothetical protein T10_10710 [Trichinella papuae]|uniref:DUF5641 domain-containing protein n=1 Tax=Trichinella papuae TaxID=268474 RepID=A0A0V1MG52_9BILA|nr:hypothetical protein T10_10710 [Trichinella papuae]
MAMRRIEWTCSTDRAPWCGGYWERLVRSVKNALRKAQINDRPLTLLSDDPHDCAPLTPAHFLIGRELASLPIPAAPTSAPTNTPGLCKRWRYQELKIHQDQTAAGNGDLVFQVEEGVPRNQWKLGVITESLTGSDGITRSVGVQTARGVLTRLS